MKANVEFIDDFSAFTNCWKSIAKKFCAVLVCAFTVTVASAQSAGLEARTKGMHSENGWYLSPHGSVKVLMLFVEIDYDLNPGDDPNPKGTAEWKPGQLPSYKDDIFDAEELKAPQATMSRYYHDCSLGNLRVTGDYWYEVITIKESEMGGMNLSRLKKAVCDYLPGPRHFKTGRNTPLSSFDQWKNTTPMGRERMNEPDDEFSFDHVMMLVRNFTLLRPNNGSASGSSFGTLFGYRSDTHSQFAARDKVPQVILRHEFNHLLIGGNNFHCCGGSGATFTNYFIPTIYGWGMMGLVNSSFGICNAWDRYRLGWKAKGRDFLIGARTPDNSRDVLSDLDASLPEHQGQYLLRDFASTGDALRIKLPFIPENEFPQYLWVENHQTAPRNGVESDQFVYSDADQLTAATPGLYMLMQIDRNEKEGAPTFGGYADYMRPILADGFHDFVWTADSAKSLIGGIPTRKHIKSAHFANPLTGSNDMQAISFNKNPDDQTLEFDDILDPLFEIGPGGTAIHMPKYGHARHAFTMQGNRKISVGANPSANSMMTYVSGRNLPKKDNDGNNRAVRLNGISIEIMEERNDGSILVNVRFDDTNIENQVRWCADLIELHDIGGAENDLEFLPGAVLTLDHGRTATRRDNPTFRRKEQVFVSPTSLELLPGTNTFLHPRARLLLENGSRIVVQKDAVLHTERKSKVVLKNGSQIIVEPGGKITGDSKAIRAKSGSEVIYR